MDFSWASFPIRFLCRDRIKCKYIRDDYIKTKFHIAIKAERLDRSGILCSVSFNKKFLWCYYRVEFPWFKNKFGALKKELRVNSLT